MRKKVVLAYSGGLDTSVCVKWLMDKYDVDVVACTIDVGQGVDKASLEKRAKVAGATKLIVESAKEEFVSDYIIPALKANAVYEGKYLLATALSRPLIAKKLVDVANKENAHFIAHGCTGKGNDQVRLEVSVGALSKNIKIIAPVREWELTTRESEIEYAKENNIPIDVTKKKPYSIDKNVWGISIECGVLEDPWVEPPMDVYQMTKNIQDTPAKPRYVEISFERGEPKKLDGKSLSCLEIIQRLNKIGGDYGVGRTDMVENRLVGIKSREIYESPAGWILFTAHRELEAMVLDRELTHYKRIIEEKYAEVIYYGLWFSPLKSALDGFINKTQEKVTGTIRLKLEKGCINVVGRRSENSLYKKELATYEEGDKFNQRLAEGFIQLWGLPYKK